MVRKSAVAGMFYEANPESLKNSIEQAFIGRLGPGNLPETNPSRQGKLLGLVCPHAGYMYSGEAAAWGFNELAQDGLPDIAVLLGPNHYGMGASISISPDEEWQTPLGTMQTDSETAQAILDLSEYARSDKSAHIKEHSIEAELPFLQYLGGNNVKIVPIAFAHLARSDAHQAISDMSAAIAKAVEGKNAVIIASTDFTHYESKESASKKDAIALNKIKELDGHGLADAVYDNSLTMCGFLGTAVMLEICKKLGATRAEVLTYYTSGDVTGDTSQVVGYAAASISK